MDNVVGILGNGLLGTELHKQTGWDMIGRSTHGFDINDESTWNIPSIWSSAHGVAWYPTHNVLINCIAHTDTYSPDRDMHWEVNVEGTAKLVKFCNRHRIKLVHISTDYIYANSKSGARENDVPVHCENWYGYTKLLADGYVQLESNDYLLIRTTHKAKPFSHKTAWINQFGNFDYVDVIASKIIELINMNSIGIYNVGTDLKTMYDLAKQTNMIVSPSTSMSNSSTPTDTSMDVSKMKRTLT